MAGSQVLADVTVSPRSSEIRHLRMVLRASTCASQEDTQVLTVWFVFESTLMSGFSFLLFSPFPFTFRLLSSGSDTLMTR